MEKQILPGMFDLIPEDPKETWRSIHLWQHLEDKIKKHCQAYGFEEIRTPLLEKAALFLRSSGETSEIVSKELYEFFDKGERHIALRPEGTASAMRAYMEQPPDWQKAHSKLYYIESMFRYDRPQAGRYRQHHQFGIESIGNRHPECDAECIELLYTLFLKLGIENIELHLNSIGSLETRERFIEALKAYYLPFKSQLSPDSQRRLEQNPLRILDSKDPVDIGLNREAPSILDYLDAESRAHFEEVQSCLNKLHIPFKIAPHLVRGLDYYNYTVFEMTVGTIGAQNSIGGGGRYDGLLKKMGGPDLPAFGFGAGLERIFQTMLSLEIPLPQPSKVFLYLIPLGEKGLEKSLEFAQMLRAHAIPCEVDLSRKKLGKMMEQAHLRTARYTAVIGEGELERESLNLKEMESGEEIEIAFSDLLNTLKSTFEMPHLFDTLSRVAVQMHNPGFNQRYLVHLDEQLKRTVDSLNAMQNQVLEIKKTLK